MSDTQRRFFGLELRVLLLLAAVMAVAAAARYVQFVTYVNYFASTYGSDIGLDRIGESYHRWVMDMLTLRRGGWYADFEPQLNQAIYWLPLYNYLSITAMLASQNFTTAIPRLLSALAGTLTPAVVVLLGRKLYNNMWHAAIGGLTAATLPWFIDYSIMGVPHVLLAFFVSIAVYAFVTERPLLFGLSGALAVATGYEGWVIIFTVAALAFKWRGWVGRKLVHALVPSLVVVLLWVLWSAVNTGNPAAFVVRYLQILGWHPAFNPSEGGLYMFQLLVPTFFIGLIAIVWGLYRGQQTRILSLGVLSLAVFATVFHVVALDLGSPARLLPVYPIIAALFPPMFPQFKGGLPRKTVLVGLLLIWLVLPQYALVGQEKGPLTGKSYIVAPEYRVGNALADLYQGGNIISDSPIVIYYSRVDPAKFIGGREILWYGNNPDNSKLADWLKANNVQYIIWENSTSSELSRIFPGLGSGTTVQLGQVQLIPLYEDTLRRRQQQGGPTLWEHDFPGTPDLIIYQLQFLQ